MFGVSGFGKSRPLKPEVRSRQEARTLDTDERSHYDYQSYHTHDQHGVETSTSSPTLFAWQAAPTPPPPLQNLKPQTPKPPNPNVSLPGPSRDFLSAETSRQCRRPRTEASTARKDFTSDCLFCHSTLGCSPRLYSQSLIGMMVPF